MLEWAKGKSEAEVVAAINGEDSSEVGMALAACKNDADFYYTRNYGAALIKAMQVPPAPRLQTLTLDPRS